MEAATGANGQDGKLGSDYTEIINANAVMDTLNMLQGAQASLADSITTLVRQSNDPNQQNSLGTIQQQISVMAQQLQNLATSSAASSSSSLTVQSEERSVSLFSNPNFWIAAGAAAAVGVLIGVVAHSMLSEPQPLVVQCDTFGNRGVDQMSSRTCPKEVSVFERYANTSSKNSFESRAEAKKIRQNINRG